MNEDVTAKMVRVVVAKRLSRAYRVGTKKEKLRVSDQFCEVADLYRYSARRYLCDPTIGNPKVYRFDQRMVRPTKYWPSARKLLIRIWTLESMPCGKYLAANLPEWIDTLARYEQTLLSHLDRSVQPYRSRKTRAQLRDQH